MNKTIILSILGCAAGLAGLTASVFYLRRREKKADGISRLRGRKLPNQEPNTDFSQNSNLVQEEKEGTPELSESSKKTVWFPKSVHRKKLKKYFKVVARCGHVGMNYYLPNDFFCCAENAREAARKIRNSPRVKHDHKFAIFTVQEISEAEFFEGCRIMRGNAFFKCQNQQEQRLAMANFIFENRIPEEQKICFKKRHPLRAHFNNDETFELLKNFRGEISPEEIA